MKQIKHCFIESSIQQTLLDHVGNEHILIISSTGTGKTTILHSLVNDTPNAIPIYIHPQEVNVQWIRKKLYPMVKGQTTKQRILVFDEIDLILESSQHLIATILEELPCLCYASCSDPHKIISGIKSKCMTFRLPPLSANLLQQACRQFYYAKYGCESSKNEEEKIIAFSQGNLTRMKIAIDKLQDTGNLINDLHGQSFIDCLFEYYRRFEHFDIERQQKELPIMYEFLQRYYEKNNPMLWDQFENAIYK